MAVDFLHGAETVEVDTGSTTVSVVKSAVICLVGTAPLGAKNTNILLTRESDTYQFGQDLPGFTIPQALSAIYAHGPATVIVTNVFDPIINTANVALESRTITNGKLKLSAAPIGDVNIFLTNGTTPFSGVKNVDFKLDEFGNFTALSSVAAENLVLKFTYKKLDTGTITTAQIIGENNAGVRTGTFCWETVYNTFGFYPKIIIAPTYVEQLVVTNRLVTLAEKYRAIALVDSPAGTSTIGAIAGRGPAGSINFNLASNRVNLLHPHVKFFDNATLAPKTVPYSPTMAGVIAETDRTLGYWVSPSNKPLRGLLGLEYDITASINDASCDANLLNEKGITTMFSSGSSGLRSWGNRSAAFPSVSGEKTFIVIRRIADIVHESLELAMLPYIDKPINKAVADAIRETGNAFFRTLISRGAILPGSKVLFSSENSATELANGHIYFDLDFMGPTPAERITFKSFLNTELLISQFN